LDEFTTFLSENPDADIPLGVTSIKKDFFEQVIYFNMNDYVDWELGTADFDNAGFISLLQASEMLPMDYLYGSEEDWQDLSISAEMIVANRQLMLPIYFGDFNFSFLLNKAMFGGDLVFKGFPAENRIGNMLYPQGEIAINAESENKEAAWEFIRSFLKPEFARRYIDFRLPLNKVSFNKLLDDAMTEPAYIQEVSMNGVPFEIVALTEQEADRILEMLDRVSVMDGSELGLLNIINEGVSDFFSGRVTAEQAARIIQNRASIYMSERN